MNLKKIYAVSAAKTKKFLKSQTAQRMMMLVVLVLVGTIAIYAQKDVGGAIANAGSEIAGYVQPVRTVIYGIAGVVSLMGAISIYIKMNNGDQDVKKSLMMVVGGVVALVAMAEALPSIFA